MSFIAKHAQHSRGEVFGCGCRYSELSWDVVEPVTYFTSQLWAILGYCYFLVSSVLVSASCHSEPLGSKSSHYLVYAEYLETPSMSGMSLILESCVDGCSGLAQHLLCMCLGCLYWGCARGLSLNALRG